MATMSPLRRRMIEDMTVRNLSPATQQSYLYAVAKFSRHFSLPPAQLGTEQVRAYQLHLIAQKRSKSHINQVACALRFFYGVTGSMQIHGGWLRVELGFGLTERGWAGAEAGVACEAGGGAASRRDDRDRGHAH